MDSYVTVPCTVIELKYDRMDRTPCTALVFTSLALSVKVVVCINNQFLVTFSGYLCQCIYCLCIVSSTVSTVLSIIVQSDLPTASIVHLLYPASMSVPHKHAVLSRVQPHSAHNFNYNPFIPQLHSCQSRRS